MKEKRHKYLEDLLTEYIELTDEQNELKMSVEKAQNKFNQHLSEDKNTTYKYADAEDLFKFHNQARKYEDRKKEISEELSDIENSLKEFLLSLQGAKISFDRKDDNDKSKSTYTFSMDGDSVKCDR